MMVGEFLLTYNQANRFLRELPFHLRLVARFCLSTGLRRENILSLKWSQVAFATATVQMTAKQMKNKKGLTIPLNEDAMRVLILAATFGNHDEPLVFTYKGKRMHGCCTKVWYKALKRRRCLLEYSLCQRRQMLCTTLRMMVPQMQKSSLSRIFRRDKLDMPVL